MNSDYSVLRDPESFESIKVHDNQISSKSGKVYEITDGIPRFVEKSNYSDDFGFQWKKFSKTQLDSYTGLKITEDRLKRCLGEPLDSLKNKLILEAGSGAGRFTEILLKQGGNVHSFDYSSAVDANAINNGDKDSLTLVQADIRKIPFEKNKYDFVICLGVLQHTPNPEESIKSLWNMVKPGGRLIIDHYIFSWRTFLPPPIGQALGIYRKIVLSLQSSKRFKFVKRLVDFWFPFHWTFRNNFIMTRLLRRLSPVIFHYEYLTLKDKDMYYQWSLLDTHDSTTDYYRHTRTKLQIKKFLMSLEAKQISVNEGGNGIEASCVKKD
jgi:SAM-dependent methyltransferase